VSAKRKRVVITTEQKLEAARRIKNGDLVRNVAADFGVVISTVPDWVKSKSKLEEHSYEMLNGGTLQQKKKKRCEKSSNQNI
jgi:transposase-like protein